MTPEDIRPVLSAMFGIGLSVVLIVKGRLHPFIALLCGAFVAGLCVGMSPLATAAAVQKGGGDILGGTGLVVALGLSLGAMLQLSDGTASLARGGLKLAGNAGAPRASCWSRWSTDTFRTWSVLETVVSVVGLVCVLGGSYLL